MANTSKIVLASAWTSISQDTILQPGMTVAVEPAIYTMGQWGIQIKDSIHVTEKGFKYMTVAPKPELVII